jgi:hypothetical protein
VVEFCEIMRRKHKMDERDLSTFRLKVFMVVVVFAGVFIQVNMLFSLKNSLSRPELFQSIYLSAESAL